MPIDPSIITGVVSAGTSLANSLFGNEYSEEAQERQNKFSAEQAEISRNWQSQQKQIDNAYNSVRHQVQMFREAGISPALIGQQGGFQPSVSGSGAQASSVNTPSYTGFDIGDSFNKFASARKQEGELKTENQLRSGKVVLQNLDIDLGRSQLKINKKEYKRLSAVIDNLNASTAEAYERIGLISEQKNGQQILNRIQKIYENYTERQILAELGLTEAKTEEARWQARFIRANMATIPALVKQMLSQANLNDAMSSKVSAETANEWLTFQFNSSSMPTRLAREHYTTANVKFQNGKIKVETDLLEKQVGSYELDLFMGLLDKLTGSVSSAAFTFGAFKGFRGR